MVNFYDETFEFLEKYGKTFDDIWFFSNGVKSITVRDFFEATNDLEYDNGYGGEVINPNLIGIGLDFVIVRRTYDGAEWWDYIDLVQKPAPEKIDNVIYDKWQLPEEKSLEDAWVDVTPLLKRLNQHSIVKKSVEEIKDEIIESWERDNSPYYSLELEVELN